MLVHKVRVRANGGLDDGCEDNAKVCGQKKRWLVPRFSPQDNECPMGMTTSQSRLATGAEKGVALPSIPNQC